MIFTEVGNSKFPGKAKIIIIIIIIMSMFPVVHIQKLLYAQCGFLFSILLIKKYTIFLSIEQEDIHTNNDIGRGHILFDINE